MRSIDWFQGPCPQRIPDMRLEPVDLAKKIGALGTWLYIPTVCTFEMMLVIVCYFYII